MGSGKLGNSIKQWRIIGNTLLYRSVISSVKLILCEEVGKIIVTTHSTFVFFFYSLPLGHNKSHLITESMTFLKSAVHTEIFVPALPYPLCVARTEEMQLEKEGESK